MSKFGSSHPTPRSLKSDESDYDSPDSGDEKKRKSPENFETAPQSPSMRSADLSSASKLWGGDKSKKALPLGRLTEMLGIEGDPKSVIGFDPARWIVAAGLLEKRRDGRMREGWAKRWFVLGKHTLYYYLLPKTDNQGFTPLLGDERGQIKLSDVLDVQETGQDKEYYYLTVLVNQIRKNTAAGILSSVVSQLQLRTPLETGHLWKDALLQARDAVAQGSSPARAMRKEPDNLPLYSSTLDLPVSSASEAATFVPTVLASAASSTASQASQAATPSRPVRKRRESIVVASLSTPEEVFPLASPAPNLPFVFALLALIATAAGGLEHALGEEITPTWVRDMPTRVYLFLIVLVMFVYYEIRQKESSHDSIAREARFRVERMRKEIEDLKKSGVEILLPQTSSEAQEFENVAHSERHCAGSSMKTFAGQMKAGRDFMSWQNADSSTFKLRIGPDYKRTGAKAPSADSLYMLIGVDLLKANERMTNIGSHPRIDLPTHRGPAVEPSMDDIRKAGVPRLFIINAQIPEKSPPMIGKHPSDDTGFSLVFYFLVKPAVIEQYLGGNISPAMKLLRQYVTEHKKNPDIRRRFKAIGMAENTKELGLPGLISKTIDQFNGKPAIINKVAEIYESQNPLEWFEVDISIFDFPVIARKALNAMKDRVSEISIKAGFVFQGETDEELPECLLGGGDICGLDFRLAKII